MISLLIVSRMKWLLWSILLLLPLIVSGDLVIDKITPKSIAKENFNLNSSYQVVLIYHGIDELRTKSPFRVKTSSNSSTAEFPILVVAEQIKQVAAWTVPLTIETEIRNEIAYFSSVSKTLCHDDMDRISTANMTLLAHPLQQSFIINLSTSSRKNVSITVELEEEKDFYVELDRIYELTISPSEPRYVYFEFDEKVVDTVVIEIYSEDSICLTVSVQDSKCPVFDMEKDIMYEGIHQTINTKGAITIKKREYEVGFFLVFVAKTDNHDCSQDNSYIPRTLRTVSLMTTNITSNVNFSIRNSISASEYIRALAGTMIILAVAFVILLLLLVILNRHGTISHNKYDDAIVTDYYEQLSEERIMELLKSTNLTVSQFARNPMRIKRRSYNYVSHTLSIAVFYSIPVVQLVVTYQRIMNLTGNEDLCYYNFLCAHPLGPVSDFNHVFSNIGYIVFGLLFLLATYFRHRVIKIRKDKGIPVHNGLFLAMGVALVIEGLLSACYHVCPSQSNYQFDTSFMYVMAVLCMIKLYQNRHPEINATAYTTFTILGAAIFMAMIGILNGSLTVWILFVVCYSMLLITISFKIYFMNYVLEGLKNVQHALRTNGFSTKAFLPIRKARFVLLILANIANYGMLIAGLMLYSKNETDFGTFLLGLLMGNGIIHCAFYTSMKGIIAKERICYEAIIYGILALVAWAAASVFFLDASTLWTVTPAESRQWNQECIVARFYDKHDVWHLLSAPALYFTFMYLMHLDDDIMDKPQSELPVF